MTTQDRAAIEELYERLATVAGKAPPREPEAEALIRARMAAQPGAPYYMAQAILAQENALALAQLRIDTLEAELAQRPQTGGFLGGLFGDGRADRRDSMRAPPLRNQGPWERSQGGAGGFLAGAAQTALSITTGLMIGTAITSMLGAGLAGPHEPEAGTPDADSDSTNAADADNFAGADADVDPGDFDVGGDMDF